MTEATDLLPEGAESQPRALVLGGYGLNCDYETEHAFRLAGAVTERVHINQLISGARRLAEFDVMAFIGGFAWADDHGAGVILATKLRRHLEADLERFIADGRYVIGICNGFQALVNLGLLPAMGGARFEREVALTYNDCGNFRDQWVHLRVEASSCVFSRGLTHLELPVRHAEGKLVADPDTLARLEEGRQVVLRYARPDGSVAGGEFPYNPNGSMNDIAGICDPSGRVFGLMPHPEAFTHFTNHPDWTRQAWSDAAGARPADSEQSGAGLLFFENVVKAARERQGTSLG
jgi:phosphoribosylformylglycinamidine synthase subunit PurQ / glutaminase